MWLTKMGGALLSAKVQLIKVKNYFLPFFNVIHQRLLEVKIQGDVSLRKFKSIPTRLDPLKIEYSRIPRIFK